MIALAPIAQAVGAVVMAAGGFAIAAGLLWVASWTTGKYAWRTWNNLTGIYKLHAMQFWFKRMSEDGTHVLRKAHEDGLTDRAPATSTATPSSAAPAEDAKDAALLVKELNRIAMTLAADLVRGADYTFQGHDYLDRNFVCERVMQWRGEWDATAPAQAAIVDRARSALASTQHSAKAGGE